MVESLSRKLDPRCVGFSCPDQGRAHARAYPRRRLPVDRRKGFAAPDRGIGRGGGHHQERLLLPFRDKNDMARQLFDRFLVEDVAIIDTLEKRAHELSDDPLQSFLIFLNLYAQMMDDMETLHPGCMVATVTYQERLFDAEVKRMNVEYLKRMRRRFAGSFKKIVAEHPPRVEVDLDALADHLTVIVEGAIVLSKALSDPGLMGKQTRLYRNYIKLIFGG